MEIDILEIKKKHPHKNEEIIQRRKFTTHATSPRLIYYRECISEALKGKNYKTLKGPQKAFRDAVKKCSIEAKIREKIHTETAIFTKSFHFDANIFDEGIEEEDYNRLKEEIEKLKEECRKQGGRLAFRTTKRTDYSRIDCICEKPVSLITHQQ